MNFPGSFLTPYPVCIIASEKARKELLKTSCYQEKTFPGRKYDEHKLQYIAEAQYQQTLGRTIFEQVPYFLIS